MWCNRVDLNHRPLDFQSSTLPTELRMRYFISCSSQVEPFLHALASPVYLISL